MAKGGEQERHEIGNGSPAELSRAFQSLNHIRSEAQVRVVREEAEFLSIAAHVNDFANIYQPGLVAARQVTRRGESFARQPQHSRQIISAAARNDAQSRLRIDRLALGHQAVDHLIDDAVAANGDNLLEPVLHPLTRKRLPLATAFRKRDLEAPVLRPKHLADLRPQPAWFATTRLRIDYEKDLHRIPQPLPASFLVELGGKAEGFRVVAILLLVLLAIGFFERRQRLRLPVRTVFGDGRLKLADLLGDRLELQFKR